MKYKVFITYLHSSNHFYIEFVLIDNLNRELISSDAINLSGFSELIIDVLLEKNTIYKMMKIRKLKYYE
jgi:hypothetical protein